MRQLAPALYSLYFNSYDAFPQRLPIDFFFSVLHTTPHQTQVALQVIITWRLFRDVLNGNSGCKYLYAITNRKHAGGRNRLRSNLNQILAKDDTDGVIRISTKTTETFQGCKRFLAIKFASFLVDRGHLAAAAMFLGTESEIITNLDCFHGVLFPRLAALHHDVWSESAHGQILSFNPLIEIRQPAMV